MASPPSPTSSCSSSFSRGPEKSNFESLPVVAMKERLVDKILENRVTLIVGETGCGKSSQVPQFLLEKNMAPILCTQPRRFAVVAVAKMVAKVRNCELGEEIGYHIGHSKCFSERSKIVFKTAGVLLEEMRDKGLNALKYKVIILDEVHERSVESDLILVCVKQLLFKSNDVRVVLMSATADIARYREYFKDLGRGERVEVLAIPSANQHALFQKRVSYLEQATKLLGVSSESLASEYCSGPCPSSAAANMKPEVHKLIHDLVMHIHLNEPDIEKGILVFLPTYHDLEQQWRLLEPLSLSFKVHILHRSIDTEQALMAMKILKFHRKVILATNIAESSVTIPKVAYVIDSCRSLQVFWDSTRKRDRAELAWVSKSQADQRRGRTGRTCHGHVYRLVTRSFFNKLEDHESPAILKLSLRQQVLLMCCAESRAINDPKVLMQKALDPPNPEIVEDALNLLVQTNALVRCQDERKLNPFHTDRTSGRIRYEPTFYGRLLASFSLCFDASVLIVKFGEIGLLREGILLGILMDIQPLPILHPFGEKDSYENCTFNYFGGDCNNLVQMGPKEMGLMGNLHAFQFWQRVFKDKHHLKCLHQMLYPDGREATTLLPSNVEEEEEEEWCSYHKLMRSSLNQVSEIYEDILQQIHRFRPRFLQTSDGLPTYYNPNEFEHTCILMDEPNGDMATFAADDEHHGPSLGKRKCCALPFVSSDHFRTINVAKHLSDIVKEMRVMSKGGTSSNHHNYVNDEFHDNGETVVCVYFMNGSCTRGSQCPFSHSIQARRATCKYFFSLQGCRNGDNCKFSHDLDSSVSPYQSSTCMPEDIEADTASLLRLLPAFSGASILLLDDTDLRFSTRLSQHYDPSKLISTTCMSETFTGDPALANVRIVWGQQNLYQTIISEAGGNLIAWNEVNCILWFPNLDAYSDVLDRQKIPIQEFFKYLATLFLSSALYGVQVILTMNNIKFAHLQVENLARGSFFFLRESVPYDEARFGELVDTVTVRKPMVASKPVSYVFELHVPGEIHLDNYASALRNYLNNSHGST